MNDQASEAQALFESLDPLAQTAILATMRAMLSSENPLHNLLTSA